MRDAAPPVKPNMVASFVWVLTNGKLWPQKWSADYIEGMGLEPIPRWVIAWPLDNVLAAMPLDTLAGLFPAPGQPQEAPFRLAPPGAPEPEEPTHDPG